MPALWYNAGIDNTGATDMPIAPSALAAAISAARARYLAEVGCLPVTSLACEGGSDECTHLWHPDEYGQPDALPWGSVCHDDGTFVACPR